MGGKIYALIVTKRLLLKKVFLRQLKLFVFTNPQRNNQTQNFIDVFLDFLILFKEYLR